MTNLVSLSGLHRRVAPADDGGVPVSTDAISPGLFVRAEWFATDGRRTWPGRVTEVDERVVIAEPLGQGFARPHAGSEVIVVTGASVWPTSVLVSAADELRLVRPHEVPYENRRSGLRLKFSREAVWSPLGTPGQPAALQIVDVSVSGARVLAERNPDVSVGTRVQIAFDGETALAEVRSTVPHDHARLCYYGLRFIDVPPAMSRAIHEFVSGNRQDPASWA